MGLDRFGQRLTGYVVPPLTGGYVFHFAAYDQVALFLSADEDPAHARQIAAEPVWNDPRNWSGLERCNPVAPENRSSPVRLEQGRRYWFAALVVDLFGGDFDGFTWQLPGGLQPSRNQAPLRWGSISLEAGPVPLGVAAAPQSATVQPGNASWGGDKPQMDADPGGVRPFTC